MEPDKPIEPNTEDQTEAADARRQWIEPEVVKIELSTAELGGTL